MKFDFRRPCFFCIWIQTVSAARPYALPCRLEGARKQTRQWAAIAGSPGQFNKKGRSGSSAAPSGNDFALRTIAGRGRDHPSRDRYATDGRLRPTTCVRASSSTRALRAIAAAPVPPVCFPIHGVPQLHAADGRLSPVVAGRMRLDRPEAPVHP
jgi:hypothetical protein